MKTKTVCILQSVFDLKQINDWKSLLSSMGQVNQIDLVISKINTYYPCRGGGDLHSG